MLFKEKYITAAQAIANNEGEQWPWRTSHGRYKFPFRMEKDEVRRNTYNSPPLSFKKKQVGEGVEN